MDAMKKFERARAIFEEIGFDRCATLDELKKAYKAAAKKYHPDKGGDCETMQDINRWYGNAFEQLKTQQNERAATDPEGKVKATTETAGEFIDIINALLKMEGLTVELCGRWLWIGGDTFRHKDALRAAGCKWSASKKLWSWHHAEDGDTWHRGRRSMQSIRNRYGSTLFEQGEEPAAIPA